MDTTEKIREEVGKAVEVLKRGGVILYPTDTIWGLGCDATNAAAVKRIYEIKHREDNKSMLVLIDDARKVTDYADVPDAARQLVDVSVRPLTIIYPNAHRLAPNLINASDGTIGIRVTSDPFCCTLLSQLRRPIVSTSANLSGEPSPACFDEIGEEIRNAVDYVVDYRREEHAAHTPSDIIKLDMDGTFKIIRKS